MPGEKRRRLKREREGGGEEWSRTEVVPYFYQSYFLLSLHHREARERRKRERERERGKKEEAFRMCSTNLLSFIARQS